jgi:hypothetical protein
MASKRDYKAEYARRIARGQSRGLSRSAARGHARAGEIGGKRIIKPIEEDRIQLALQILRKEHSLTKSAKAAKISPEHLRKYAIEKGAIEKSKGRWQIRQNLLRRMLLFSRKHQIEVTLGDFDSASLVGRYMNAVRHFLNTNQRSHLHPFVGISVRDVAGKFHPFETDPNSLYRLADSGDHAFEQIYRLVL